MNKNQLIWFLCSTHRVDQQAAESINSHFSPFTLLKNDLFLKAARVSDAYLFINNGFMRAFAKDTEGNETTTGFYTHRQVVFKVSSFFNRTASKENIQALTDCEGWMVSYLELNRLFPTLHRFSAFGRHILVTVFAALKERLLAMIT